MKKYSFLASIAPVTSLAFVPLNQDQSHLIEEIKNSVDTVSNNTISPELFGQNLDWTSLIVAVIALIVSIFTLIYQAKVDANTKKMPSKDLLKVISNKIVRAHCKLVALANDQLESKNPSQIVSKGNDVFFIPYQVPSKSELLSLQIFPEDIPLNIDPKFLFATATINIELRNYNLLLDSLYENLQKETVNYLLLKDDFWKIIRLLPSLLAKYCLLLDKSNTKSNFKEYSNICATTIKSYYEEVVDICKNKPSIEKSIDVFMSDKKVVDYSNFLFSKYFKNNGISPLSGEIDYYAFYCIAFNYVSAIKVYTK